jgi:hypothetical protein
MENDASAKTNVSNSQKQNVILASMHVCISTRTRACGLSFYIFAPYATDTQTDKQTKRRHSHELYNRHFYA